MRIYETDKLSRNLITMYGDGQKALKYVKNKKKIIPKYNSCNINIFYSTKSPPPSYNNMAL